MITNGKRHHTVTFGSFEMDLTERLLLRNAEPVHLAPKLFDTLAVLVENAGHLVEKEVFLTRIWGETFVEDGSLSQNIFQLRKILAACDSSESYIETIPKRGYRFTGRVVDSAAASGPSNGTARAAVRSSIRSIAVMPFADTGAIDGDPGCLGLGMTDAIIVTLNGIRDIKVTPMRTMMKYAGRRDHLQALSRQHGVEALLEGSVQKNNGRIRVTVQLIDLGVGTCEWSGQFDGVADNVFALQDVVARRVANFISPQFSEKDTASNSGSHNIAAFQSYLLGVFFSNRHTRASLSKAIGYFEDAIGREPVFARAHAGLADAYFWSAHSETSNDFRQKNFECSRAHALKAIELDPHVAEAYAALGTVQVKHDHDAASAEASFLRAIEVDPTCAMAYSRFTYFLAAAGRLEEALAMSSRAQQLDPLSPDANATHATVLYFLRRYDDAIRFAETAVALEPTFAEGVLLLGRCFEQKGMFDEAEKKYGEASRLESHDGEADELLAHLHAVMGRTALAAKELSDLSARDHAKPYNIAAVYSALGDRERASAWLKRPFINWTERLRMLRYDPRLDRCRPHVEFH